MSSDVQRLAGIVSDELGSPFTVATTPDLPHLFAGPDILIGGEGRLTGVFVVKRAEARSPNALLARLGLSRLGLPPHMLTLLIVRAEDKLGSAVQSNFHYVLERSETKDIIALARLPGERRLEPVPPEVRERAFIRGELLTRLARRWDRNEPLREHREGFRRWTTLEPLQPAAIPSWSSPGQGRRSRRVFESDSAIIAGAIEADDRLTTGDLPQLAEYRFRMGYYLDSGILYPSDRRPAIAFLDDFAQRGPDPQKPIRAAAFAGWLVLTRRHPQEREYFADRLSYIFDRGDL